MNQGRRWLGLLAAGLMALSANGPARAADEYAGLVERARHEGQVTWYTTYIVQQLVRPMVAVFERKYPGIRVSFARSDSTDVVLKLVNETRARRVVADVFDLSSGIAVLKRAGISRAFSVPSARHLPPEYRDPEGHWVSPNYRVLAPAYNTRLVPEARAPRTFEDLLDPAWRGRMVWKPNDMTGAPGFIANVLRFRGEARGIEYLCQLSHQNVVSFDASVRAVLDRTIAGEYGIALQVSNHHVAISSQNGAPVKWVSMEPVMVSIILLGVTRDGPHPNAAELFVDFMISEEGQRILREADYLTARPDVPAKWPELTPAGGGFKAQVFSPEEIDARYNFWSELYEDIFVRRSASRCEGRA